MIRRKQALLGAGATAVGALAAGFVAKKVTDGKRLAKHLEAGEEHPFGSLSSPARIVTASDGVGLHVEVDGVPASDTPTVVFVHGWTLNLDAWHYQRAALRDRVPAVFYDHRSHGESEKSSPVDATLDQLADDLAQVIAETAPEGPLVLVGHSMGGMTIMQLAADRPDWFAERVVGVVLCSTAAGDLVPSGSALGRVAPFLKGLRFLVDTGRSLQSYRLTRQYAVGPEAPEKYAVFTYDMIGKTKTYAFVDFYPIFLTLDVYGAAETLRRVPVTIVAGRRDQLTPHRHARRIHELVPESELLTRERSGHMTPFEDHELVTEAIERQVKA